MPSAAASATVRSFVVIFGSLMAMMVLLHLCSRSYGAVIWRGTRVQASAHTGSGSVHSALGDDQGNSPGSRMEPGEQRAEWPGNGLTLFLRGETLVLGLFLDRLFCLFGHFLDLLKDALRTNLGPVHDLVPSLSQKLLFPLCRGHG